ncbi:hypothetical protein [Desulfomicrobium salsuginis]
MLPKFLDRLTPRVYPRTRLLTAALVWSAVGFLLTAKGLWISRQEPAHLFLVAIAAGLGMGLVKSRLVFDKVARKIILNIEKKPRPVCLGGLFSVRNWALILVMSFFGRTLGAISMNTSLKTGIYVMVGSGLALSSLLMWKAWKKPLPFPL